jgi:hypothetical protein
MSGPPLVCRGLSSPRPLRQWIRLDAWSISGWWLWLSGARSAPCRGGRRWIPFEFLAGLDVHGHLGATVVHYLSLAFWTATAFSPTDISAVKRWAKLLMTVGACVSLGIFGLVVARAVNVLQPGAHTVWRQAVHPPRSGRPASQA